MSKRQPNCNVCVPGTEGIEDSCSYTHASNVVTGQVKPRIPYQGEPRCSGCGVILGGIHHPGCYTEICPFCNFCLMTCRCPLEPTIPVTKTQQPQSFSQRTPTVEDGLLAWEKPVSQQEEKEAKEMADKHIENMRHEEEDEGFLSWDRAQPQQPSQPYSFSQAMERESYDHSMSQHLQAGELVDASQMELEDDFDEDEWDEKQLWNIFEARVAKYKVVGSAAVAVWHDIALDLWREKQIALRTPQQPAPPAQPVPLAILKELDTILSETKDVSGELELWLAKSLEAHNG